MGITFFYVSAWWSVHDWCNVPLMLHMPYYKVNISLWEWCAFEKFQMDTFLLISAVIKLWGLARPTAAVSLIGWSEAQVSVIVKHILVPDSIRTKTTSDASALLSQKMTILEGRPPFTGGGGQKGFKPKWRMIRKQLTKGFHRRYDMAFHHDLKCTNTILAQVVSLSQ